MATFSNWRYFPPTDLVSDKEFRQLTIFEMRVSELNANWNDLFPSGGNVSISINREHQFIRAAMPKTNPHRLKGLYADYRVFTLQDRLNFKYISNLVKRRFRHSEVCSEIDKLKSGWQDDLKLGEWFGHSSDEIFDAYFNAALFHGDDEKMDTLEDIIQKMTDESLHVLLTFQISNRRILLNKLRLIIEPLTQGDPQIRIPRKKA